MATYTKYKNLENPSTDERYNIGVANKNNNVIDSEFHKLDIKNQKQDELIDTLATNELLNKHTSSKNNPHEITKEQIGLGHVDNTFDIDKPVSTAQQDALDLTLFTHNSQIKTAPFANYQVFTIINTDVQRYLNYLVNIKHK